MRLRQAKFQCSCGGAGYASSTPPEAAQRIVGFIRDQHLADGHHEVDDAEYARIRARQRRTEQKELQRR